MAKLFFTSLFLLLTFVASNVKAQQLEEVSELTPYSEWLDKKIEEYKKANIRFIIKKPIWSKVRHFFVKGILGDKSELVNFSSKVEINKLENGENLISISFESKYDNFAFEDIAGKPTSKIRFFGRIISKDKKFDKVFEDFLSTSESMEILLQIYKEKSIIFKRSFTLPKGKYDFKFIITDIYFGNVGKRKFKLEIK